MKNHRWQNLETYANILNPVEEPELQVIPST